MFRKMMIMIALCTSVYSFEGSATGNLTDFIYESAHQIVINRYLYPELKHLSTDEFLFYFFSKEIEKLDPKTLEQNPELIFRRATLEILNDSWEGLIEKNPETVLHLLEDFQFVMDHSNPDSRLFAAAKVRKDYFSLVRDSFRLSERESALAFQGYRENILRQWATNPSAKGKELLEDVYKNIQYSPDIAASFFDYFLLLEEEPDVALGYSYVSLLEINGLRVENNGIAGFDYHIEYFDRFAGPDSSTQMRFGRRGMFVPLSLNIFAE